MIADVGSSMAPRSRRHSETSSQALSRAAAEVVGEGLDEAYDKVCNNFRILRKKRAPGVAAHFPRGQPLRR